MNKTISLLAGISILSTLALQADPAQYAQFTSTVQAIETTEFLNKITLRGDEKVIDFGCRTGKFALWCASQLPKGKVLAVDHDPAMLAYLQTQLKKNNLHNTICIPFSTCSLGLYKNQFDLIGSFAYLHWVGNYESTFALMNQVLKPGGKLIMRIGVSDQVGRKVPFQCHVDTIANRDCWKKYFTALPNPWYHPLDMQTAQDLLTAAGFNLINISYAYRTTTFATTQDLAQWILTWDPHAAYLSNDLALSYASQIAERYDAVCPHDAQGNIILERPALEIEAQKA